jgi:replicative DNA helicase
MSKQKTKVVDTSSYSLPHNLAAEKAVIGMLLMESTAINEVMSILDPDMFYDSNLSVLYSSIRSITDRGDKIDMLSVTRELIRVGKLEEIGGPYFISELTINVASSTNISDHAKYIHQLYLARKLAVAGHTITSKALDQTNDIEEVISESLTEVENVAAKTCYNVNFVSVGEAARRSIERYSEREERVRKGVKLGVPTGLGRLDKCTGGFKPQEVIVLAARPAMGKNCLHASYGKNCRFSRRACCNLFS